MSHLVSGAKKTNKKPKFGLVRQLFLMALNAATLVLIILTVIALSSRGLVGSWIPEIFAAFWFQYAWGALVLLAIHWLAGQKSLAVGLAIFSLMFLPAYAEVVPLRKLPFAGASSQPASQGGASARVMFSNVLYENTDFPRVLAEIRGQNPDVVVMVEMPDQLDDYLTLLLTDYPFHARARHDFAAFQVSIFSKLPMDEQQPLYLGGADEPALSATIQLANARQLRVIGIHPTPPFTAELAKHRDEFMNGLAENIRQTALPTVLGGDFNNTPTTSSFQRFLATAELDDSRDGLGRQGSWPSFLAPPLRIPIDHALTNSAVTVTDRWLAGNLGSDHLPIVVEVSVP